MLTISIVLSPPMELICLLYNKNVEKTRIDSKKGLTCRNDFAIMFSVNECNNFVTNVDKNVRRLFWRRK
jgi:hypothetical protein